MTKQEYEIEKANLHDILQNGKSEKSRLRAAELLIALREQYDASQWNMLCFPHEMKQE